MTLQDELAQAIRTADRRHSLGAGALADALMPFVRNVQAAAFDAGYDEHADDIGLSQTMHEHGGDNGNPHIEKAAAAAEREGERDISEPYTPPTARVYGHGCITLTHYPSSGRLGGRAGRDERRHGFVGAG